MDRRRSLASRSARICLAFVATVFISGAPFAAEPWSRAALENLFPPPADGWTRDPIDVQVLDTLTSDFEGTIAGVTGSTVAPSARLQLTDKYRSGDKAIELGLDTEQITIVAAIQVAHENESIRQELAASGKTVRTFGQSLALEDYSTATKYLLIQIGKAGVAVFTCSYADCERDIEAFAQRLDLDELNRFADYDHRKSD